MPLLVFILAALLNFTSINLPDFPSLPFDKKALYTERCQLAICKKFQQNKEETINSIKIFKKLAISKIIILNKQQIKFQKRVVRSYSNRKIKSLQQPTQQKQHAPPTASTPTASNSGFSWRD